MINTEQIIPLISLTAYTTQLEGIDNNKLTEIILSSNKAYREDILLPDAPEIKNLIVQIKEALFRYTNKRYILDEIWGLILKQGQSVMAHSHKSNTHLFPEEYYSVAYYPSVPEGSAELLFMAPYCNSMETITSVSPKEGMLVVFNSFVPHMTARHSPAESRIVISGNLRPETPTLTIVPDWGPYKWPYG